MTGRSRRAASVTRDDPVEAAVKDPWPRNPWERLLWERERNRSENLFSANDLRTLYSLLGRLPTERRHSFLLRAERSLRVCKEHWRDLPRGEDWRLIERVEVGCAALQQALRATERNAATSHWLRRAYAPEVSIDPAPEPQLPFDALLKHLDWLCSTARELRPTRERGASVRDDLAGAAVRVL